MKTLKIEADKAFTKNAAIMILVIGIFFASLVPIALLQGFGSSGPIDILIFFTLFPWLICYSICSGTKLLKVSKFKGPLLTINANGVIDHFHDNTFLAWKDIEFSEWKTESGKGVSVRQFRILPKHRTIKDRLLGLIGLHRIRYAEPHLSTSAHDIAKFMLSVAPKEILK